jgi:hypothetical protein
MNLHQSKLRRILYRSHLWILATIVSFTVPGSVRTSQSAELTDDFQSLVQIWKEGRYLEALQELKAYRLRPYGKIAEVDYMIASSMCRLPAYQPTGQKYFQWLLYNYALDEPSRNRVVSDMRNCATTNTPVVINFIVVRSGAGARVGGKMMYPVHSSGLPVSSVPVKVLREIPRSEMAARLAPISDPVEGIAKVKRLLGAGSNIEARGHFLLAMSAPENANTSNHEETFLEVDSRQKRLTDARELSRFGDMLEDYLNFFSTEYKCGVPTNFITVYCQPSTVAVRKIAERLHGIQVSELSIGYSFRDDLSLVGLFDGTIVHELFHLLVHNDFGDVPPWLDEGGAALYEGSTIKRGCAKGVTNWREDVLREFWYRRPSIEDLVKMDWRGFDDVPGDYRSDVQAVNHATARYFVFWLQEEKKLKDVYLAFRNRKVEDVQDDPQKDAVRLMENVTSLKIAAIDQNFALWWTNNFGGRNYRYESTPLPNEPSRARGPVNLPNNINAPNKAAP